MRLVAWILIGTIAGSVAKASAASVWDSVPDDAAPSDTLTFVDALARVKRGNPNLRAAPVRVAAAHALIRQAGAWPNPTLALEAENVAGSYSGFDDSELSLWLFQDVELGGKRSRRAEQSTAAAQQVARAARTDEFDVYIETRARYAAVVSADERSRLAREATQLVDALARSADERVRAGAALTADGALAQAELVRAQLAIENADTERLVARGALAALWGDTQAFDEPVAARIDGANVALPPDSAASWARYSPVVEERRLAYATHRADAAVERSLRVPDLVIGAGARRVEADDASTFLFSLGLPLPLWNRRTEAIQSAEAFARASEFEVEAVRAAVAVELASRIRSLAVLRDRLHRNETSLTPTMSSALENMRTAYGIGRVSYSDLLDVERALVELRFDAADMRREVVEHEVAVERLTGRTIQELMNHE